MAATDTAVWLAECGLDLPDFLDAIPLGAAVYDTLGRVLHLNASLQRLTGFRLEEARGLPCRHVLRTGLCGRDCLHLRQGGCEQSLVTDIVNRSRRKIPVRLSPRLLRDRDGQTLYRVDFVEELDQRETDGMLTKKSGLGALIGKSAVMEGILSVLPEFARSDRPVLLVGETGTGKDLIAECIHEGSLRARRPFLRMNLGFLPANLLEAELFGRTAEEGSGLEEIRGRFQEAAGGSMFFPELSDAPLGLQKRLAAFLDTGAVCAQGGAAALPVDVRLLFATQRNPEELAEQGLLDPDFYKHLSVLRLDLPPLRQRGEDLPFLLAYFAERFAERFKKSVKGFSPEAMSVLAEYPYPGNVRELRNIVEYAVMTSKTPLIVPANLPVYVPVRPGAAGFPAVDKGPAPEAAKAKAARPKKDAAGKRSGT
ncbi:MAG: sigma 54-interacting transcriptional regulator [Acidobacteriota bacterium]